MDNEMSDDELARLKEKLREQIEGHKRKQQYEPVFSKPAGDDWRFQANWEDAYYGAAFAIVQGVVERRFPRRVEGIAGLYLFRHYLELTMKYIVMHSRWLQDPNALASADQIQEVKKTHSLRRLWELVRAEALPKIENEAWKEWDIEFVERCVMDFDAVDPGAGERFRYHGTSFGGRDQTYGQQEVWVDFSRLLEQMPHVRDVLGMIDLWLYETQGQLQDWEQEMGSW